MGQMGFFDVDNRYATLDAKHGPLAKINAVVPWETFRGRLEKVWRKPPEQRKSNAGCKPWDAIVMFKAIILCALYNLSNDQVEYQIPSLRGGGHSRLHEGTKANAQPQRTASLHEGHARQPAKADQRH